jgi:hypothetical protein
MTVNSGSSAGQDWALVMLKVFDLYGSGDRDLPRIRDLMTEAASVTFALHHSEYAGGYYLTTGPSSDNIEISLNELEDEDGHFLSKPEYPQCLTLVRIKRSGPDPVPLLDDLRARLEAGSDLIFLRRRIFTVAD